MVTGKDSPSPNAPADGGAVQPQVCGGEGLRFQRMVQIRDGRMRRSSGMACTRGRDCVPVLTCRLLRRSILRGH